LFPYKLKNGKQTSGSIDEFIAKLNVFLDSEYFNKNNRLQVFLEEALERWALPYIMCVGVIIRKGVPEFDSALVIDVVCWLEKFPNAHNQYKIALQQYSNNSSHRDVADNLRKSLEAFLQEYLDNSANLKNNISRIGEFLKKYEINTHIRNMLISLMNSYMLLNNETAKHNDLTDKRTIEFLLYQTGIFMRFLIELRSGD